LDPKKSILDLIKSRRSCRKFKQDPVPDEDIMGVLEAAKWAPSGANSQPWKFIIIKNKETMEKIVESIPYKEFQNFLRLAPVLIVVLGNSKKKWHIIDCSLATQNLMLEAWARGLGTCFSAWWPTAPQKVVIPVKEILKIPEQYMIITMTPLGYPIDPPKEAFHLPAKRKNLEEIISYETFSG
jgi:nitroreductase